MACAFRCTSTCPTSGSLPTAQRPSPFRSTLRIRGWRSSKRHRCSKSRAASMSGACESCATRRDMRSTMPTVSACGAARRRLFGLPTKPYPEFYTPKPYSKSFVLHLDAWYAQSHPDEDFAETFAVWLTPNSEWRNRYAGWPALKKLAYMDALMQSIRGTTARVVNTIEVDPLSKLRKTLRQHYKNKRRHYGVDHPEFLRSRSPPAVLRIAGVREQHHGCAVHRAQPPSDAPAGGELDGHLPVHDRPGARRDDCAESRAQAAPCRARRSGSAGVRCAPDRAGDELPAGWRSPRVSLMKKLRILALVHDHLVPPEDTTGIDVLEAEWKMEYDVIETLAGNESQRTRARTPRRARQHPSHGRSVQAPHRVQPDGGVCRRDHVRSERRQLSGAASPALYGMQPARSDTRPRQVTLQAAACLPSHRDSGFRGRSPWPSREAQKADALSASS